MDGRAADGRLGEATWISIISASAIRCFTAENGRVDDVTRGRSRIVVVRLGHDRGDPSLCSGRPTEKDATSRSPHPLNCHSERTEESPRSVARKSRLRKCNYSTRETNSPCSFARSTRYRPLSTRSALRSTSPVERIPTTATSIWGPVLSTTEWPRRGRGALSWAPAEKFGCK
jgi:hypothetical protein